MPPLGQNDVLVDGEEYALQADIHGWVSPYGDLAGTATTEFEWDGVNEASRIRFEVNDKFFREDVRNVDVFYPAYDEHYDWRDRLQVAVQHPDPERWSDPMSPSPTQGTRSGSTTADGTAATWSGRDHRRRARPRGHLRRPRFRRRRPWQREDAR